MHDISPKHDIEELSRTIGARVRHERQARGWTLDILATEAGVSRRMLVSVEQGAVNPSVGTLLRISDALGVGLPALVEPPHSRSVTITKAGEGAALWSGERGSRGVLVAGTAPPDVVELWDWTLAPDDRHTSAAHSAGTKELFQVLQGTITLVVGEQCFAIEAGDAVTFPGDIPHAYTNPGPYPARFILTVFEPDVGTDARPGRPDPQGTAPDTGD